MDASAGAGAARGVGSPGQGARKEWRVVSEHHSSHMSSDGEPDRSRAGQSDERTIYEVQKGRELGDVDFCSVTIDGGMQSDILQQRLNHVSRQREELQQMEIELRAQVIVRLEIMEIQKRFEAQIKEHANNAVLHQEQINGRDQTIQKLESKMEEKDREIHAIKLDNDAAWAKEGLLREQLNELGSFRSERDNSEAERAQHFQQIHDLQEHIKEKERQFLELQEQQRVAQETILFKDEQLREAQAWMTRAHELDTLHTTTNHSLQAELRERTEHYNQLWAGCQRQFAEMERLHFNAIQQLQLKLAEARGRNGTHEEESAASRSNTKDASQLGHDNGHHDASGSVALNGKSDAHSNGIEGNATYFVSVGNAPLAEHNLGVPFMPSLLGLAPYLSPPQMAVQPFMIHQQGVSNPTSPHVAQNHAGHFQSVQTNSPMQYWQNQLYEMPVDGQTQPQYVDAQISQRNVNGVAVSSTSDESQDQISAGNVHVVEPLSQHSLQHISSQFQDTLNLNHLESKKIKEGIISDSNDHSQESTGSLPKTSIGAIAFMSDTPVQPANSKEAVADSNTSDAVPHAIASAAQVNLSSSGKTADSLLLDERLLLACIARTMPASGKISISSTLPNRLAKMLAPLHWHDYKKIYGKIDDFIAGHSELFVIEGDSVQLKDGAQQKIAAAAASAAAAAALSPYSSVLPFVAVTPMAQSYRLKKSPSNEVDHNSQFLGNQTHHFSNGTPYNVSMSSGNGSNVISSTNARMPAKSVGRQHGRS